MLAMACGSPVHLKTRGHGGADSRGGVIDVVYPWQGNIQFDLALGSAYLYMRRSFTIGGQFDGGSGKIELWQGIATVGTAIETQVRHVGHFVLQIFLAADAANDIRGLFGHRRSDFGCFQAKVEAPGLRVQAKIGDLGVIAIEQNGRRFLAVLPASC